MSNLFKSVASTTSLFSDSDLRKMSQLWYGNDCLTTDIVKEKWKNVIGEVDAEVFVKRLRQTVLSYKAHIKRLYKIDPDLHDQFEKEMVKTIFALESVYISN